MKTIFNVLPIQVLHESEKRKFVEENFRHVNQHILANVLHSVIQTTRGYFSFTLFPDVN